MIFHHHTEPFTFSVRYSYTARTARRELYSLYYIEIATASGSRDMLRIEQRDGERNILGDWPDDVPKITEWPMAVQGALQSALQTDHFHRCYDMTIDNVENMANVITRCKVTITEKLPLEKGGYGPWTFDYSGMTNNRFMVGLENSARHKVYDQLTDHWYRILKTNNYLKKKENHNVLR